MPIKLTSGIDIVESRPCSDSPHDAHLRLVVCKTNAGFITALLHEGEKTLFFARPFDTIKNQ